MRRDHNIADVPTAIRECARTTDPITRLAIGLVAAAVTGAVVHTIASSQSVSDAAGAGSASLALSDRVTELGVTGPSGVAAEQTTGHLLVVGDEGRIAELGPDRAAIRTQPAQPGIEDTAILATDASSERNHGFEALVFRPATAFRSVL